MHVCMYTMCVPGGQERVLDAAVVSHPRWVLGTKARSSASVASAVNSWVISPGPPWAILLALVCASWLACLIHSSIHPGHRWYAHRRRECLVWASLEFSFCSVRRTISCQFTTRLDRGKQTVVLAVLAWRQASSMQRVRRSQGGVGAEWGWGKGKWT